MKITVTAKTRAKKVIVEMGKNGVYKVLVPEAAVDGKANEAIRKVLAAHFKVPASRVKLLLGARSKKKVFEIK